MLFDKIIEKRGDLKFPGLPEQIDGGVVFYINEPHEEYALDAHKTIDRTISGEDDTPKMPSEFPYNNIFLQFNDSFGLWATSRKITKTPSFEGEQIIIDDGKPIYLMHIDLAAGEELIEKDSILVTTAGFKKTSGMTFQYNLGYIMYYCVLIYSVENYIQYMLYINPEGIHEFNRNNNLATGILLNTVAILWKFLQFLSCTNTRTVKKTPPTKLQKKRIKRGKKPLVSYHVLELKQKTNNTGDEATKGLWSNRVHLCRGHFRAYTPEKPMFGKLVGKYWCPPHVRGNRKSGVVVKDYSIDGGL